MRAKTRMQGTLLDITYNGEIFGIISGSKNANSMSVNCGYAMEKSRGMPNSNDCRPRQQQKFKLKVIEASNVVREREKATTTSNEMKFNFLLIMRLKMSQSQPTSNNNSRENEENHFTIAEQL